jgi:hypothetical protein
MKISLTKFLSLVILCSGLLVACTPSSTPQMGAVNQTSATSTETPASTNTITPTSIPVPTSAKLPLIFALDSAKEITAPVYNRTCATMLYPKKNEFENLLQDFSSQGIAVFGNYINDLDAIILFDLTSGQEKTIPSDLNSGTWADDAEISPDRKWLFYLTAKENEMLGDATFVLSNSSGESSNSFPVSIVKDSGYSFNYVYKWVSTNSLKLLSKKHYKGKELIILLFNPFTENISILQNDFDGLQSPIIQPAKSYKERNLYLDWGVDPFLDIILAGLKGANIAYSPNLHLAFYPHQEGYDVLYDIDNQQTLAQVMIPSWGELPKWSPDGKYISLIAPRQNNLQNNPKQDFYLLSSDGEDFARLTFLSDQFERMSIKEYSWSPDGTQIAFWLDTDFPLYEKERATFELAVVDVASGNVTNYCIQSQNADIAQELVYQTGLLFEPVWSPDGTQLLINILLPVDSKTGVFPTEIFLLDLSKLTAIKIKEDVGLYGWMVNGK